MRLSVFGLALLTLLTAPVDKDASKGHDIDAYNRCTFPSVPAENNASANAKDYEGYDEP